MFDLSLVLAVAEPDSPEIVARPPLEMNAQIALQRGAVGSCGKSHEDVARAARI